jgi:hypothetical protein
VNGDISITFTDGDTAWHPDTKVTVGDGYLAVTDGESLICYPLTSIRKWRFTPE